MALISPILDNRSYAQLRDELVARIPVFAPEWTNHNESDPGIALLELFAHLGESLLFRFNQIPDTAKVEFLRLLGVRPRPAQPARVLLSATTSVPEGVGLRVDAEARAGAVSFSLLDEVHVWPLTAVGVGKTPETPGTSRAEQERVQDALARAKIKEEAAQFYRTVVLGPDPLAVDAAVLDVSGQVDGLWVALLAPKGVAPRELPGRIVFVGVAFDESVDRPFALEPLTEDDVRRYRSSAARDRRDAPVGDTSLTAGPPPMLWQIWTGLPPSGSTAPVLQPLTVVGDTTEGMVTTGVVKVELPDPLPVLGPSDGRRDSPPPLTDEEQARKVVAWLRVSRPRTADSGDAIHRVRWVGLNAVSAVQARTAAPELLGVGTGEGGQVHPLGHTPVLPGTVRLEVEEPDGWQEWQEVDDLGGSGVDARHYTVDLDHGLVAFSNGTGRARVPQIGERIRVVSYRYGGGASGNVAAGAVNTVTGSGGVTVTNPLPAVGGADRVSLAEALDAIPTEVHRHDRAVTTDDFAALAAQVSGVARAEALDLLHPDTPRVPAAGVVSVVVFPHEDVRDSAAPLPDLGLLRRVAGHLDARRLVTTELYVIPPEYRALSLSVGVAVRAGHQVDAVRRWVEQILRQYLAPVPPFGPDGRGWPLGRAVRRAELEAVAVQVDGVEFMTGLLMAEPGAKPVERLELDRWQVLKLADITAVAGTVRPGTSPPLPLPLGTPNEPAPPEKTPIPIPPDVC
jgi:predicted phage baseplate assembly protein